MEEVLEYMAKNPEQGIKIMLGWNKYHSAENGESFMEAFMDDADSGWCWAGGQKVKYGNALKSMLLQQAEALGIYDECKEDFAAIDKEMKSWFYIDNGIAKNYDNILKKIAEKMGSKYGSPSAAVGSSSESQS